ncbi:RNA polymerase recycling motor ATPase HelR [Microlunatus aurantiacus]|uniref:RNA polymerase recycling motor ATPase HelR n=1 Tax=Microlunatus aurantiacus TaxID=446786 RepID=A0ABP7CP90_9ACTN
MRPPPTDIDSPFALPDRLAAKADPEMIGGDREHLSTVTATLAAQISSLGERLGALRASPGGVGRAAADRDREIHRLSSRLRLLRRFGLDLCLGKLVYADDTDPVYIGRIGLSDAGGRRLLIDWRADAAEPFFAATHARPLGLASRRRYRWDQGRITDYWDEVFISDGLAGHAALDDQSAFIASLGSSRSPQMRDVLATIATDQDAIIRASSRGALVVDGGPGTGKTVVALHRAAYLLYADPHVDDRRGGVLFVGPHRPYLAYVADVLPGLGEEGVQTCTLRDLVGEGAVAVEETEPEVARLKASAQLVSAIEPAVALYEEPPTRSLTVETPWGEVEIGPDDWAEAFASPDPGLPHNLARDQVWEALVATVADQLDHDELEDFSPDAFRSALRLDDELTETFTRAWTLIEPTDLVADLWSVPAYLRRCAPWLGSDEIARLQRSAPDAWTVSDLPLLDAARRRLGDPATARRSRQREAAVAAERAYLDDVIGHLLDAVVDPGDDLIMLKGEDLQSALVHTDGLAEPDPDLLAGPFAHVVVDEAQELTDAEWQMLRRRCPSGSFTVVGDRAQARRGFPESWAERLDRVGLTRISQARLTINYRTPEEVMAEAEPVIRAVRPDANVPTSVRRGGIGVRHGSTAELDAVVGSWLAEHPDGIAAVIAATGVATGLGASSERVRRLTPELAKGLEFDLVVLIEPETWGAGDPGSRHGQDARVVLAAVDTYVAMTRATQQLVVLHGSAPAVGARR